jgi:hypothetical protein
MAGADIRHEISYQDMCVLPPLVVCVELIAPAASCRCWVVVSACTASHLVTRLIFRDTCWTVGNVAHIKTFIGVTWSFSLINDSVCKDFVDAVRLGISACLSRTASSHDVRCSVANFQAAELPQSPLQRSDSSGASGPDDVDISVGMDSGSSGSLPPSPTSATPKLSPQFLCIPLMFSCVFCVLLS